MTMIYFFKLLKKKNNKKKFLYRLIKYIKKKFLRLKKLKYNFFNKKEIYILK